MGFAARKSLGASVKGEVTKPHIEKEFKALGYLMKYRSSNHEVFVNLMSGHVAEEIKCCLQREGFQLMYVEPIDDNMQAFFAQAGSTTFRAGLFYHETLRPFPDFGRV